MEPHDLLKLLRVHHQMWRVSSNLIYFYFSKEAQFNTVKCQMLIYYTKYMKGSIKMSRIITHNLYENQETWVGNTTSVTTGMSEGISKRLNKSWTWSARFFRSCYSHPALAAKSQTCIKYRSDFKSVIGKGYGAPQLNNQEVRFGAISDGFTSLKSSVWHCTNQSGRSCLAQPSGVTVRIRTGYICNYAIALRPSQSPSVKYTTSVTLLTAGHHIYRARQTVWYHGHKLAQIVYEAIAEGGRKWAPKVRQSRERQRKFKRASVYWCTSLSSQQEFFPCFIITARLPMHKRLRRGGWITSWCHFLNFHLRSHWETAWFQMWWVSTYTVYSVRTFTGLQGLKEGRRQQQR